MKIEAHIPRDQSKAKTACATCQSKKSNPAIPLEKFFNTASRRIMISRHPAKIKAKSRDPARRKDQSRIPPDYDFPKSRKKKFKSRHPARKKGQSRHPANPVTPPANDAEDVRYDRFHSESTSDIR